jgi:hypothetical protein
VLDELGPGFGAAGGDEFAFLDVVIFDAVAHDHDLLGVIGGVHFQLDFGDGLLLGADGHLFAFGGGEIFLGALLEGQCFLFPLDRGGGMVVGYDDGIEEEGVVGVGGGSPFGVVLGLFVELEAYAHSLWGLLDDCLGFVGEMVVGIPVFFIQKPFQEVAMAGELYGAESAGAHSGANDLVHGGIELALDIGPECIGGAPIPHALDFGGKMCGESHFVHVFALALEPVVGHSSFVGDVSALLDEVFSVHFEVNEVSEGSKARGSSDDSWHILFVFKGFSLL